ncbi:MAG: glycerate kinase [Armatimonadota bacterium]|nr:glycerate kinase [Armatimonadota bacterium]
MGGTASDDVHRRHAMKVDERLFHGETAGLRRDAVQILDAAVAAADPGAAVRRALHWDGGRLRFGDRTLALAPTARILVVGAGKAASPMAAAVEQILGERIAAGVVTTKYGYVEPLRRIQLVEAGHPLPDAAGLAGARRMLALVATAGRDDLVVVLISGGGSALLPLPAEGITLEEKIATTDLLLRSGATINEMNTVRKHLSQIKGGWLARRAAPATVLTLVLSDVLGNPLDVIASGPTVPDPSTFRAAVEVVRRFGLWDRLPASVRRHLERGAAGAVPETPKPKDPAFRRAHARIVGDITSAAAAAAARAQALGYDTYLGPTDVQGEARDVGAEFARMVRETRQGRPACLVMGGETTVTVRGTGRGGRNQELALGAAAGIAGLPQTLIAAFGTDGTDGPTDAAGAVVDGSTLARAQAAGLDLHAALANNDAYTFFQALGDLIITGPTNTNVNDLWIGLLGTIPAGAGERTSCGSCSV